ncbi:MAG: dihydrofolate reductase family protein, partial [Anaerolineaceae bacterium]|nr:dihydrofolate reductase family protein [Anaerolineaceae bacterium]
MRKIILFNMITLDGFFAGPDGNIDWHKVDEEFNDFAVQQLHTAGGLIFGRVTYQLMAGYWPTPAAVHDDPIVADLMNTIPKTVFSRTLNQADWDNTRLVKTDAAGEVSRLKGEPGKDVFIFGSGNLASSLT